MITIKMFKFLTPDGDVTLNIDYTALEESKTRDLPCFRDEISNVEGPTEYVKYLTKYTVTLKYSHEQERYFLVLEDEIMTWGGGHADIKMSFPLFVVD